MIYEKEYPLRVSDFDKNDVLRPSAILDMFQSVAEEHARILGIGYEELLKKDCVWVLLRSKYDVLNAVVFGTQKVIVKTWPLPQGRGDYDRDYAIYSVDGELLVKGSSKWCVINYLTRRLVFGANVEYPTGDEIYPVKNYEQGLKKIADFNLDGAEEFLGYAGDSAVDHNGHINNVKYCDFMLDALALPKGVSIKGLEINYLSELQIGKYSIYHVKDGDNRLIKGFSDQKESFRAVIELS